MPREAARKIITDAMVKKVKPAPTGKRAEYWDAIVPGFGLRVTDAGGRSFFLRARVGGEQVRMSWPYPATTLEAARVAAKAALDEIERGGNPKARKAEEAHKEEQRKADTVEEIVTAFIERYAKPKNRGWKATEQILRANIVSRWGKRPIGSITKRDIIELLDATVDRGSPIMANRLLAYVARMFGWCVERGIIEHSPTTGVKVPGRETSRDRVLSDDELHAVWQAAAGMGWPFGPLVQLLALTAQRREEVAGMTWEEIDLDRALWTIPKERAKNGLAHEVPLSGPALAILATVPRTGPLLFSTTGRTAVSGFSRAKTRLDSRSGVADWTVHDLRRTATTGMAQLGIPPHVADKVLNHKSGSIRGVAAVYNRHSYIDERRDALETWGKRVMSLVERAPIPAPNERRLPSPAHHEERG
jgi:integrase